MMKKISVIICCYNTEKYVEKCINSILNQTYQNIEIIIVEDHSTDNTKEKLLTYKSNPKVRILMNEQNKGLSYSRNRALEIATGDYIGYIDSDDYVEPTYYERLMQSIQDNHSEVAICGIKVVDEDGNLDHINPCYQNNAGILSFIDNGLAASACNKLFQKEAISKYPFSVGKVNEDIAVVIPTLMNACKVSYANDTYYYYVQRNHSIQNSSFSEKRFDIFYGVDLTLERIKNHCEYMQAKEALVFNQLIVLLLYVIPKEPNFWKRNQILKKYNKLIQKYHIENNSLLNKYLESQTGKSGMYVRFLIKCTIQKWNMLENIMIAFYRFLKSHKKSVIPNVIRIEDLVKCAKKQQQLPEKISITAVIPNYNYEKFLYQRFYSVLNQNVKIKEIVILDDCSTDYSRNVIDEIVTQISPYITIKKIYNKQNSGSAFRQWQKGLKEASGDYVWIAEADDYCQSNMIENLTKPLEKNSDVIISYCDTAFINTNGYITYKSIIPEIDIMKTGHWNCNYVIDGIKEYEHYSFLNCTIANVSSCIFRKGDYDTILEQAGTYKQAGDWFFYVYLMHMGKVAFCNKTLNYYREHGNNVSSITKKEAHMQEIKSIHQYFKANYGLNEDQEKHIHERYEFLKIVWDLEKKVDYDKKIDT